MGNQSRRIRAFTLVEFLLIAAVIVLLAAIFLPPMLSRPIVESNRTRCANNLRMIGLAFSTWPLNRGDYPMDVLATNGGPAVNISRDSGFMGKDPPASYLFEIFGVMSNELSTPRLLICPEDERTAMTNFNTEHPHSDGGAAAYDFCNANVSYFVGLRGNEQAPQMFLAGDRNIINTTINGSATMPSLTGTGAGSNPFGNSCQSNVVGGTYWSMGTNFAAKAVTPAWTPSVMHKGQGNILLCDGSVQQVNSAQLRKMLAATGDTNSAPGPNTLMFP